MNHAPTPSLEEIASCVNGYDPDALPISQAREFIDRLVPRLNAVEWLPLRSALGRVLAHDIVSTLNVPAHDNSAMDGYAFAGAELGRRLVSSGVALCTVVMIWILSGDGRKRRAARAAPPADGCRTASFLFYGNQFQKYDK